MRVPTRRAPSSDNFDRSITPMVDVVFQLLIFFVLASAGPILDRVLATSLSAGTVSSLESRRPEQWVTELWVNLKRNPEQRQTLIELNGRQYADFASLRGALLELAAVAPESPVILDIAADVPLGDVIRVYDMCRAAKYRSINFAAPPEAIRSTPMEHAHPARDLPGS